MTLTVDLLTLKVVSESRETWATSVPILVYLGLSVLGLGPMYATDRRQTKAWINAPAGGGITIDGLSRDMHVDNIAMRGMGAAGVAEHGC